MLGNILVLSMDAEYIFEHPLFRMLIFLAFVGYFFYRDYPNPESKWYTLLVYWLFILFLYCSISGMITAGVFVLFGKYIESSTVSQALEKQLTITSLGLLFLYRLFSRYIISDESTRWSADFIKGIIMPYIAFFALFYAFSDYLGTTPKLVAFSETSMAFIVLGICFVADFLLWVNKRSDKKSIKYYFDRFTRLLTRKSDESEKRNKL